MKEHYNLNPYILSDKEIDDYVNSCCDRLHGFKMMLESLSNTNDLLSKEMKIHTANYEKIKNMRDMEGGTK